MILGVSAQELGEMTDNDYDQIFQKVNFKEFIFKIRAKMDVFNVRKACCLRVVTYFSLFY